MSMRGKYKFTYLFEGDLKDDGPSGYDLSATGTPTYPLAIRSPYGGYVNFADGNAYANKTSATALVTDTAWTIGVAVQMIAQPTDGWATTIIEMTRDNNGLEHIQIKYHRDDSGGDQLKFIVGQTTAVGYVLNPQWAMDEWHFVFLVNKGAYSNTWDAWIDGIEVLSDQSNGNNNAGQSTIRVNNTQQSGQERTGKRIGLYFKEDRVWTDEELRRFHWRFEKGGPFGGCI
jgi:hypothetical protein